jgi:hypothetical protein
MMLTWIFFFFVAFGAKVVLAFAMIYLIFPSDRVCSGCDGETLPIRMGPAGRLLSWMSRGAVQRRWCPRCGWEGLTRSGTRDRPSDYPEPAIEHIPPD